MTDIENKILNSRKLLGKNSLFDYKTHYSDEFYDKYISLFCKKGKPGFLYLSIKRLFDFFSSLIAIVLLLPVWIVFPIWIKVNSNGPVIFQNRRIGKNNKVFTCFKFRSMYVNAPSEKSTSTFNDADQYITRCGRIMRKTSIDELPQLFNVLLGTMSIIGYRPLVPTEVNCNNMRERLNVFCMRPGISGYAQVIGRDDVYYKNKALIDAYYVNNASILMDIKILLLSVKAVIFMKGNKDNI